MRMCARAQGRDYRVGPPETERPEVVLTEPLGCWVGGAEAARLGLAGMLAL